MKFLTKEEICSWLELHQLVIPKNIEFKGGFEHTCSIAIPQDAGKKSVLARTIGDLFLNEGECLLWITGWNVWPSCENMDLFYGYRRSLNENRLLIEAPGHLFSIKDKVEIKCLLDLVLYFYWDAAIISKSKKMIVKTSNDEFVDVFSNSKDDFLKIENCCQPMDQLSPPDKK